MHSCVQWARQNMLETRQERQLHGNRDSYPERSVSLELSVAMESALLFAVFEFAFTLLSSFAIAKLLSRFHTSRVVE